MPGLNQLKQFTTDILALGDEVKVRASRGEQPVRAPFPKNVPEEDDSADFLNGMPQASEEDMSQAEAAIAEKKTAGSQKLPDVSDILNTAGDLDDADLSDFDLSDLMGEEPKKEEAPSVPVEDLDLDTLLQPSGDSSPADDTADENFDVRSLLDDSDQMATDSGTGKEESPAPAATDIPDLPDMPDMDFGTDSPVNAEKEADGGLADSAAATIEDSGIPSGLDEGQLPDFADGTGAEETAEIPQPSEPDAGFALPDDLAKLPGDDVLSDIPDLDATQLDVPDGAADLSLDDLSGSGLDTAVPDVDVPSLDLPDISDMSEAPGMSDASDMPEAPARDAGIDLPSFDMDALGEPAAGFGAETPSAPADTGMDMSDDFNLDNLVTDTDPSAMSSDLGLGDLDAPPSLDDDAVGPVDMSGMDDVDFSAASNDFDFDANVGGEDGEFNIPGFSDTVMADLTKKEESPAAAEADQEEEKKPKNTFTDAEYKRFLANLEQYPLNVRMAVEDFVVKNEFTDDAVFEVLDKILRKVPARQVAADLEKKLDISLQVPRDYERRSAEEYEAYKKTLEYQLKNRIIPIAVLSLMAVVLFFCVMFLSKTFIYDPTMARRYYKQGYTFIQENQYPQSEDSFDHAMRYKVVKNWFYRYAERYREHRQYERARTMYKQILRRYDHEKAAGLAWAGMEANELYNYEEAERILKREVLDYHVNDPEGILQLGDLYLDWATDKDPAKFADAKEQYDILMQLYGDKKESKTYLARQMRYYIRTDNLSQVLQYKEQSFPKSKDLPAEDLIELSGYLLGKRYGKLPPSEEGLRSRIEGLRGLLEDAVKAAPTNPYAMYNMGLYFMNTTDGKRAAEFFKHTIDMFKERQYRNRHDTYKYIDTFRLLGEEYVSERKYIDAERIYGEGIELFEKEHESSGFESTPDIGKLYSDMGDIDYFISGDMKTSLDNYIKAVSNKNDTSSVRYRIGYIQYKNRNYSEALGSFIRSSEGSPNDSHVLLSLANTLSLRDDNYAAEGYYEKLLDVVQLQRERYNILLPQVRNDQADIVTTYMKATNNLGVTLFRIAQMTGDSRKNAEAVVHLNDSLRAWDALTRNQETMERLEGSNLAAQNIKYVTEPYAVYEPEIYTDIPKVMDQEEGLE